MAQSVLHPLHEFKKWQVWPGSYENPPINGQYPLPDEPPFFIDKQTLIASMGSCFAREIKKVLVREGFSYICEESAKPAAKHASAAWERLYNTFSMRQVFEYTFSHFDPDLRWWRTPQTNQIQDPYRRIVMYETKAEARADFADHKVSSSRVLTQAKVLILTLGLTEIWVDKFDGSVICLPSGPYVREGGDMSRYEFKISRYRENYANLEAIYQLLQYNNPGCKLILTISPVHMWATFRNDADILSASCNSKSTLRTVADEFCSEHEHAFYFPAYEIATIFAPLLNKYIFTEDRENFHVNSSIVELIMSTFFSYFYRH